MNKCEQVMLDRMAEIWSDSRGSSGNLQDRGVAQILLLLDCVCEWRNPAATPVEDGCGKLVVPDGD